MEATYHLNALQRGIDTTRVFPSRRDHPAHAERRQFILIPRDGSSIIIGLLELEHGLTELGLTEEEKAGVAAGGGPAVLRALGGDVGEVDALAEHVAGDGGFGGSDAEALGEDAAEVGAAGAVPEEAAVGAVGKLAVGGVGEALEFAGSLDAEDVLGFVDEAVRAAGLGEIVLELGELCCVLTHWERLVIYLCIKGDVGCERGNQRGMVTYEGSSLAFPSRYIGVARGE